jgi:hypothetical protein
MRSLSILFIGTILLSGCSITPAERTAREQALKGSAETFIQSVVQDDWAAAYGLTEAGLQGAEELKDFLKKTWVQDGVLTAGVISSMAWIGDETAKVKINWSFQSGTVPSYSSETFAWRWKDRTWKCVGRVLR